MQAHQTLGSLQAFRYGLQRDARSIGGQQRVAWCLCLQVGEQATFGLDLFDDSLDDDLGARYAGFGTREKSREPWTD